MLNHELLNKHYLSYFPHLIGRGSRDRTYDLGLRRSLLFLLSYASDLADVIGFEPITNRLTGDRSTIELHIQIGGE